MKINQRAILPVALTLAAMLAGFSSLVMSAHNQYTWAARLIILSMILDGLDGALARLLKGTSSFGAELDTFVDMTSFGIAPALLAYEACWRNFGIWGKVFAGFMVLSGASRLSRFRIIDPFRGQQGFLGLPITCAGGFVTCIIFAAQSGAIQAWGWDGWFNLERGPLAWSVWIATILMLVLQVSHVHYTKASKHPVIFLAGVVLVIALFVNVHLMATVAALGGCVGGLYFAFLRPIFHPPDATPAPPATPSENPAAAV
ncbi:MAG: CDP-alcohol phosphatidyltransferase family protein [Kiritimatiellaeota bacterium]|nr:CDP-alcohol phosphatidyltransferase family protein [Kiritimatiellota bacterium]